MQKFIPKAKQSKKERKALNAERRATWGGFNPVTRKTENKKLYNRKKSLDRYNDYGEGFSVSAILDGMPAHCE